jgi:hypothetical protein
MSGDLLETEDPFFSFSFPATIDIAINGEIDNSVFVTIPGPFDY